MSFYKALGFKRPPKEEQPPASGPNDSLSLAGSRIERMIPPSPPRRELRSQAFYRLQVGLIGLVVTLMMVGLANIIMDRALMSEQRVDPATQVMPSPTAAAAEGAAETSSEPLSDIGVVPDLPRNDPAAPGPLPAR